MGLVLRVCSLRFGAIESNTFGCGMVAVCILGEEAEKTSGWIVLLELGFFLGGELSLTGEREDALAVLVVCFTIEGLVTDMDARLAISIGDPIRRTSGSDGFDDGWCGSFLLVDIVGCGEEEVGWMGNVFPFDWNHFFDQSFLTEIGEWVLRKGFDVVPSDVGSIRDEGTIDGGFELGDESTEARSEGFKGFDWVAALHVRELFVVGLGRSFKEG